MKKKRTYDEVEIINSPSIKTGIKTLDLFLSNNGGFELGNLILMTGTSGAGKTTLCKLIQREIKYPTLFHALESLASSVKRQTLRIETHSNCFITDEKDYQDFDEFMKFIYEDKPKFVMVDSLQHAVKQLKSKGVGDADAHHHVLDSLYKWKDETQGIVILICQLNKDNTFSGPSGMLFDADVQVHLDYNSKTGVRTMDTKKNRMGQLDSIYYEFSSGVEVMKFYTEEEWRAIKMGVTLPEMLIDTIFQYSKSYRNHDSYPVFKREFNKKIKVIYNSINDDIEICLSVTKLMSELTKKYFVTF